jgi:hypothetical protein
MKNGEKKSEDDDGDGEGDRNDRRDIVHRKNKGDGNEGPIDDTTNNKNINKKITN